jgi:hypothetical protein
MNEAENIQAALETVASHPKVATVVSAATASMGMATLLSQINTVLGAISLGIGCVVGVYVLRINAIKRKIYQRMLDNGESLKE